MAEPQNEFRRLRRGVMVRKDLLQKCNKLAAQSQLKTGDKTSQTSVVESIIEAHFKTNKI